MKKSAEQIRECVKAQIKEREIVLWGSCDDATKDFYFKYKDRMRFRACVTEKKDSRGFLDDEQTVPILEWKDYESNGNDYIVVTGSPFVHIENQLLAGGLHIFEEYIDADLLEVIISDKKVAIMAGNCQLITLYELMKELKGFTDQYHFFRFSTHYWASKWSLKSLSYLKNLCDLYICTRHEEDDPKYFRREELPVDCRVVVVPFAVIRLYWPQLKPNVKKAVNEFFVADKSYKQHGPFEYGDSNINQMIKEDKSIEEILAVLSDEDYYTQEQVENHIDMVMRTLEYEETESDIAIASYIRENYQKRMLYKDMVHMQVDVAWEMVRRVLAYLGMDTTEAIELSKDVNTKGYQEIAQHATEIPVYPSVAKHLGLEWCNKDTLYEVTFYNGTKKLTFEEYIRAYYSLCSKVKQIQEEW